MVLSAWWFWLLLVVLISAVVLVLLSVQKKGAESAEVPDAETIAGNRTLHITRIIAWLYVAACLVGGLGSAIETMWGGAVTVRLPVAEFWPALPGNVIMETPLATVEAGGFTMATVSVSGLDMPARLMLGGAVVAQMALAIVAGLVIIKMCASVMNKTLFAPQLIRGAQQLAGVVFLGGLLLQIFEIIGGTMAAGQVLDARAWGMTGETIAWTDIHHIVGLPAIPMAWDFNFWFIGAALVLLVLAELFRQGSKVQKETAGLI